MYGRSLAVNIVICACVWIRMHLVAFVTPTRTCVINVCCTRVPVSAQRVRWFCVCCVLCLLFAECYLFCFPFDWLFTVLLVVAFRFPIRITSAHATTPYPSACSVADCALACARSRGRFTTHTCPFLTHPLLSFSLHTCELLALCVRCARIVRALTYCVLRHCK